MELETHTKEAKPYGWREAVGSSVVGATVAATAVGGTKLHNQLTPTFKLIDEAKQIHVGARSAISEIGTQAREGINHISILDA